MSKLTPEGRHAHRGEGGVAVLHASAAGGMRKLRCPGRQQAAAVVVPLVVAARTPGAASQCKTLACLKDLTPDEVMAALQVQDISKKDSLHLKKG